MKRLQSFLLTLALAVITVQAQIGYQVAIMDQTSGKPKANENVSVSVTISNNAGTVICSETHDVTTNDVGIATLQIGNANTFANADWTNLPLWVSATVGGTTIAKSQILNVPVAEYAKKTGKLSRNLLCGKTWRTRADDDGDYRTLEFQPDGTCLYKEICISKPSESSSWSYTYEIDGNVIMFYDDSHHDGDVICKGILNYSPSKKALIWKGELFY